MCDTQLWRAKVSNAVKIYRSDVLKQLYFFLKTLYCFSLMQHELDLALLKCERLESELDARYVVFQKLSR